ncbi:hypothetical protein [Gimesia sp.]|uniref:hypothetical protein n=1 Tax=Gimesia sp. TaxID=2024833 RepID=UPI0025BFFABB|nr:hypothetical protein [Gimesia sp.]|tara:strand:- start:2083 stop:2967 length:885 start_codon:yes stop_codon:yes gene_type:complete
MGQTDCAMSLMKKPCPRLRFPCNRCGAKIVNAGLQWEIDIPLYKKWYYMDGLMVQNAPAGEPISTVTVRRYHPFIDPETSKPSPCNFTGPAAVESTPLFTTGQTPADYGTWVQDFEWFNFGPPPHGPDNWNNFVRLHQCVVDFEQAELEEGSGDLVKPGRWRINLQVLQIAAGTTTPEEAEFDEIYKNYAIGASYVPWGILTEFAAQIVGQYYPPDDFNCVIPAGETQRWHRSVPTLPILPFGVTSYTRETLPDGYDWNEDLAEPSSGPFYPTGFENLNAYYAPPYIDVRHVKI